MKHSLDKKQKHTTICIYPLGVWVYSSMRKVFFMNKLFTGLLVVCTSIVLSGAAFACECGCNCGCDCGKNCNCKQECADDCTCGCKEGKTCECAKQGCECKTQNCGCSKKHVFKIFRKSKCECK